MLEEHEFKPKHVDGDVQIVHESGQKYYSIKVAPRFIATPPRVAIKRGATPPRVAAVDYLTKNNTDHSSDASVLTDMMKDYGPPPLQGVEHLNYTHKRMGTVFPPTSELQDYKPRTDSKIKWLGGTHAPPNVERHVQIANKFKQLWCGNQDSLKRYPDCCGLLSTEEAQNDVLIVAPIGMPLDKYIDGVRSSDASDGILKPLGTWFDENPKRAHCKIEASANSLMIARLLSDLIRYVDCCHASSLCSLDLTPDNLIIVCRRPEIHEIDCYRLMLMAIDFDLQQELTYTTRLPHVSAPLTHEQQLIMLRSKRSIDFNVAFKVGAQSGRAAAAGYFYVDRIKHRHEKEKVYKEFENQYFDPVLDDRFQAIGIILLLLYAIKHIDNVCKSPQWQNLDSLAKEYYSIAQGDAEYTHTEFPNPKHFIVKYKKDNKLIDASATNQYLDECVRCEKIWKEICETISSILAYEKGELHVTRKTQSGGSVAANSCQDPFPELPNPAEQALRRQQRMSTARNSLFLLTGVIAAANAKKIHRAIKGTRNKLESPKSN